MIPLLISSETACTRFAAPVFLIASFTYCFTVNSLRPSESAISFVAAPLDISFITSSDAVHPTLFPPEFRILYELITIYDLVDNFFDPNSLKAAQKSEA